jgi:glycosyltransferase involved in cell wall biosynthesis
MLTAMAARDANVKVIFNARNFGPLQSNFHALMSATGDAILVFLPADLQDPPEVIPEMVRHWESGHDVVFGVRGDRQEGFLLRKLRSIFYRFVTAWTPFPVPRDAGEFQLIDRKVLEALRQFEDHYPYIRGMIAYCGFRAIGVPFKWQVRRRGKSKATPLSYMDQAINGLISFNNFPLRFCMMLGLSMSVLSIAYGLYSLVAAVLLSGAATPGIPTLIVAQFFLSGILLFVMGILSEYIYAIYSLVRYRPMVIERGRLNFDTQPAALQEKP